MSDIKCAQCGEPWDAYGVRNGDMEPSEAKRFLAGKGCPSCGFGTKCTECGGTGKDRDWSSGRDACVVCRGNRRVLVRRLAGAVPWNYDYLPNVKPVPTKVTSQQAVTDKRRFQCLEGWAEEGWLNCWACTPGPCETCHGTGKLQRRKGAATHAAVYHELGVLLGDDEDGLQVELEDYSDLE